MSGTNAMVFSAVVWRRRLLAGLGAAGIALHAAAAFAASVTAPSGAGQVALRVESSDGQVKAQLCSAPTQCTGPSKTLQLPAGLGIAALSVIKLKQARHLVHARAQSADGRQTWEALLAAPLSGTEPLVLFSGLTGAIEGQPGERSGPRIEIKGRSVVLGSEHEGIDLCGRPALLSPRVLSAKDLSLYPAKLQRLPLSERKSAVRLVATESELPPQTGVLRARAASSAVGSPLSLTDGDLNSAWAENRGGEGRGEFVVMSSPSELSLTGFDFVLRPKSGEPAADAVGAKQVWLATDAALYLVELPQTAWNSQAASYSVTLPQPVSTSCVALVVESAHAASAQSQVTFAELGARTSLSALDPRELVTKLDGPDAAAHAAATALSALGPPGVRAVVAAYPELSRRARQRAFDVVEQGACSVSVPLLVRLNAESDDSLKTRIETRILRCGDEAVPALQSHLADASAAERLAVLALLAQLAPESAAASSIELLATPSGLRRDEDAGYRRGLRAVISNVASQPAVIRRLEAALSSPKSSARLSLELLRALGDGVARYAAAPQAFERLRANKDFSVRYLLLEAAAHLAARHAPARALLADTLKADPNPHLRLRAAQLALEDAEFIELLLAATRDDNVRVRHAAVERLGALRQARASAPLMARLQQDEWPLVRAAAARSLGALKAGGDSTTALVDALGDDSPDVRRAVIVALGQQRTRAAAAPLRHVLADADEDPHVRAAAATSLGLLCDTSSIGALTSRAQRLVSLHSSESDRIVGRAAVLALAHLAPADLAKRLAPLADKDASPAARRAAEAAHGVQAACTSSRAR